MKHLINRWKALWDPDRYHGWGRREGYFEGWYFRLTSPKEDLLLAFIPGISFPNEGPGHAFIQVLDGKKCTSNYIEFPLEDFHASENKFEIRLGNNTFSADKIHLDLPKFKGTILQRELTPWPKMLHAPGIMGWYSFVPFMECYHGVVSVHHQLSGTLNAEGHEVQMDGGIGYTEKDWGTSFPSCWIWTQTNHFDGSDSISLSASVANIPWLGSFFIGYIVGFLFEGKVYRFATYTGAKMKASLGENFVSMSFKDSTYRLELKATKGPGGELRSPISGEMRGKVNESMQAVVEVAFYKKENLLFQGTGRNAGLEIAGSVEKLLTNEWRR